MEKERFIPKRMCVACREMHEKAALHRVVLSEGEIKIDKGGKMGGRGAYICKSEKCVMLAFKKRAFDRVFKMNCAPIYDILKSECEK